MSSAPAAPRAAVPVSHARAEASRQNGARSRGPKTEEGRAKSAQNALKHGLRAQKHLVLPEEDGAEFADLEAALVEDLAPVGTLQTVLARRVAVAAWRLARADRLEAEVFEQRRGPTGGLGLALIRDGNGTRSFETLLRYRGGALAEFWRALKTLKALQAEQAAMALQEAVPAPLPSIRPTARPPFARRPQPNEPERRPEAPPERRLEYILTDPPGRDVTLHDPAAPWRPNEPEARRDAASSAAPARALPISHDQPAPGRGAGVLVPWAEGSGAARREPGR